ncbi:cell envelope integrity protein TolA [Listeria booriae]|uniref:Cell envelope integrity protein TolA n=1 Tax=Listeria booriae TaxID=1552123 RepID=A0A842B366_9LIST|nr:immunoglobulin-like domain-containing protein [Listeria booriae]MBC1798580.1 cell envelope integrity protein TolA [Listeria booriae]
MKIRNGLRKGTIMTLTGLLVSSQLVTSPLLLGGKSKEQVVSAATNTVGVSSFAELKAAFENDSVRAVSILKDFAFTGNITTVKNTDLTINGNGHTIDFGNYYIHSLAIKGQKLTLEDLNTKHGRFGENYAAISYDNYGHVTARNVTHTGGEYILAEGGVTLGGKVDVTIADSQNLSNSISVWGTKAPDGGGGPFIVEEDADVYIAQGVRTMYYGSMIMDKATQFIIRKNATFYLQVTNGSGSTKGSGYGMIWARSTAAPVIEPGATMELSSTVAGLQGIRSNFTGMDLKKGAALNIRTLGATAIYTTAQTTLRLAGDFDIRNMSGPEPIIYGSKGSRLLLNEGNISAWQTGNNAATANHTWNGVSGETTFSASTITSNNTNNASFNAQFTLQNMARLNSKSTDNSADLARAAVNNLFKNEDVTATIKDTTTITTIEAAQKLVDAMTDKAVQTELQKYLDTAKAQLLEKEAEQGRQEAAEKAVKELFNNNDVAGTIKDSTNQDAINKAKELVATVTDADKKAELEAHIVEAQKQLDAKTEAIAEQARQEAAEKAVKELFNNNDVTGTIKDSTNQNAIDKAKELVADVKDADKKAELEAHIAEAQKQLTEKETKVEVTGKGHTFILQQDRYLTGTYTGDVTSMSVDVNGKRYYGGTVKNGEFNFYAFDKIFKETDKVVVNLHGADKSIQTSFAITVKVPTKITQNAYKLKDSNITGTFNNTDITKMNIVVNGKTYWGGTVANGEFKFYVLDKITNPTDEAVLNFYGANNELIVSKNLTITAPVVTSGEITSATLAVGDKNIVGTITGDIKSLGVIIDGTTYNGGTIAADGTFKFYVADKKFTADSIITIIGYDKSKNSLSEMTLTVSK